MRNDCSPVEHALLDRVIDEPYDRDARDIYADWLEEHGETQRAEFLRATDPATRRLHVDAIGSRWRALVTHQPIARCARLYRQGCAIPWEQMEPTEQDFMRRCKTCERHVYYLDALDIVASHAGDCVTFDLALDETIAKDRYDSLT